LRTGSIRSTDVDTSTAGFIVTVRISGMVEVLFGGLSG
jgi:hypothetical protein